jgi:hypothetical protein
VVVVEVKVRVKVTDCLLTLRTVMGMEEVAAEEE